jgi:hypothetical protein
MVKLNYTKKIILLIVVLVVINVILLLINIRVPPMYNQVKDYTISGTIKPTSEWVSNKPQFVTAYYPYPLTNLLCQGEQITIASINWTSENEGEYTLFLSVPDALNQVILTTDCSRLVSKTTTLDKKYLTADLSYGGNTNDNAKISEGSAQDVALEAQRIATDASLEEIKNESNRAKVKNDLDRMRNFILEYGNTKDTELGLKNAYLADLYAWKARKNFEVYKLGDCLQEIDNLFKSKENNRCYVPNSQSKMDYLSLNASYNSFYNYEEDTSQLNNSVLKDKTYRTYEDWQKAYNDKYKCYRAEDLINKTFEIQQPYCDAQKLSIKSTIVIWFIIAIFIGILIETWRREKWIKEKKK